MDHQRHFPEFAEAVRARLMKGMVEYEDKSFSKDPVDLIEELKQEALDLAGWGFILFSRLQRMTEALSGNESGKDTNLEQYIERLPNGSTLLANPTNKDRMVGFDRGRDSTRLVGGEALADLASDRSRR